MSLTSCVSLCISCRPSSFEVVDTGEVHDKSIVYRVSCKLCKVISIPLARLSCPSKASMIVIGLYVIINSLRVYKNIDGSEIYHKLIINSPYMDCT